MSELQYPYVRNNVLAAVRSLSDVEHQRSAWGVHDETRHSYDDFSLAVHILYDDYEILPDPASAVGGALFEDEVAALRRLDSVLGPLIDELGDVPDRGYTDDPRWPDVVAAAKDAHDVMSRRPPFAAHAPTDRPASETQRP